MPATKVKYYLSGCVFQTENFPYGPFLFIVLFTL